MKIIKYEKYIKWICGGVLLCTYNLGASEYTCLDYLIFTYLQMGKKQGKKIKGRIKKIIVCMIILYIIYNLIFKKSQWCKIDFSNTLCGFIVKN